MFGEGPKGIPAPQIGVGTWAWGDDSVWGYKSYDKSLTFDSIEAAFRTSIEQGVTFFDTAEIYGNGESERIIGKLIKSLPESERKKIQVASKFYPVDPTTSLPRINVKKDLIAALDATLQRLQLDHIDLYQMHAPLTIENGAVVGDALAEAVRSGRCKAVGVSNYNLKELMPVYEELKAKGIPLASNQIEFSLLRTLPKTGGMIDACNKLGIATLAYSPLGMGRLTGKYSKSNKPSGSRFFGKAKPEVLDPLLAKLREVGERNGGKTPAQVSLNWIMTQGAVPIPGAKNADQALQNAGALGWRMSGEDAQGLTSLAQLGKTNVWQHDGAL